MKQYILEVKINEGYDEFWERISKKSGRKEVKVAIEIALCNESWDAKVKVLKIEKLK